MNPKMVRQELYEDDYVFNEQEFKEFHVVRNDPYWKIRGLVYSFSLNCFGDKPQLIRRSQNLLFNNYLHKKPESQHLRDIANADIQIISQNLKCSSGKYDGIAIKDLETLTNKEEDLINEKVFQHQFPWQVVPELQKMDRKLTYADIMRGMTPLMRSTMVFYNHFQEDECLTAIVALPYTPQSLEYMTPQQIYQLAKNLDMRTNYEGLISVVDLLKQKLIDLFYTVEDHDRLHGVLPCQSSNKSCAFLASQFCPNYLCKQCCQDQQNKLPCILHDSFVQFERYKIKSLYMFEEKNNFDRAKTIRIYSRKLLRKYDLEQAFKDQNVLWDKVGVYYHYYTNKIQYVYLEFATQEQAQKVYKDKHIYELKLEKYDIEIQAMNQGIWKALEQFQQPENVIVIIKPQTSLEFVQDLQTQTSEYINKIYQLIHTITQLPTNEYKVEQDINTITQEKDNTHLYVILPNQEFVDKVYNAQPFFGVLLAHKMSHIQYLPYLRAHKSQCLMCSQKKEYNCVHDMCKECCARQKYDTLKCPCSITTSQELTSLKEEMISTGQAANKDTLCEKCTQQKDSECSNNLCQQCCSIQSIKNDCPFHQISVFMKQKIDMEPHLFARQLLSVVSEINLKVRSELKQGKYDWFRPIYSTHIQNSMIKANKELQEVRNSGNIIRGTSNMGKTKRDGKIFTFQANEQISLQISQFEKVHEDINDKGEGFIEYAYGDEAAKQIRPQKIIKNNIDKQRIYAVEDYESYISSQNLKIRQDFDLFIFGLDATSFTVKQLYQEIHQKLSINVGQIQPTSLMILDKDSILTDIYNTSTYLSIKNLEENVNVMGRVACIKFDNILDSIALFNHECKITLPLANGQNGEPIIYPSSSFIKYLISYNPQNYTLDVTTGGSAYSKLNKDIVNQQNTLSNLMSIQNNNSNNNNNKNYKNKNTNFKKNFNKKQQQNKQNFDKKPQKKLKKF